MPRRLAVLAGLAAAVFPVLARATPGVLRCGTPDALLHGAPFEAPTPRDPLARDEGKALHWQPLAGRLDSKNISVQWAGADGDEVMAGVLLDAFEGAWDALITDQGWPGPASSDTHLLVVVLDPSIAASGLTLEYAVSGFPDGVAIIYMNPENAGLDAFFRSVAAHELHHAIQFGMRGAWSSQPAEAWYWEASAEWAAELALPSLDQYAWSAQWFTQDPSLRFDSLDGFHQYGMFLLNAWLHEEAGPSGMLETWAISTDRPEVGWDTLLAEGTGFDPQRIWGGFVQAVGARELAESALYPAVTPVAEIIDQVTGTLPRLGARYYTVAGAGTLVVEEGEVFVTGPGGEGASLEVAEGDLIAAVGLADGADYTLRLDPPPEGDDDDSADDGGGCSGCGGGAAALFLTPSLLLRRRVSDPGARSSGPGCRRPA